MKDDRLYIIYIAECIDRIERYAVGGREEFMNSTLIQDAVLRNLQTLAESTQKLSENIKEAHNEIDWRGIAGFRNIVVHDYLGLDLAYCWKVVERDIPPLKLAVKAMLGEPKA